MKEMVAYRSKEKWGLRKKWTTFGLQEKKIGIKSKKLVAWGIRKKLQYK